MAQQATEDESGNGEPTEGHVTRRNPIDWLAVERDTLGTHTFDADLYDATTLDARRPAYYRTGKTRQGRARKHCAAHGECAPSTESVEGFMNDVNTPASEIRNAGKWVQEEVAVTPTEDELDTYKGEFDEQTRRYEPPYLRVAFFGERIVGNAGLAAAYGLVIGNTRNADDPDYEYEWNADYDTGEVTITVTRTDEEDA